MKTKHETKIKLFKRIVFFILVLGISFTFSSCFVDYGLDTNNYDLVVTKYNDLYNFGTANKYSLADSVVQIGSGDPITRAYDELIKQQVISNLARLGWTRVYDSTANVIVMMGVTKSTFTYDDYDWWYYWGWYPGWGYYPYYGSGWGWYYPYPTSDYSYTTASVLLLMTDPRYGNQSNQTVPVQWIAVLNGLINGSSPSSRISSGIDQAFSQSQYLKVK